MDNLPPQDARERAHRRSAWGSSDKDGNRLLVTLVTLEWRDLSPLQAQNLPRYDADRRAHVNYWCEKHGAKSVLLGFSKEDYWTYWRSPQQQFFIRVRNLFTFGRIHRLWVHHLCVLHISFTGHRAAHPVFGCSKYVQTNQTVSRRPRPSPPHGPSYQNLWYWK